MGQFDKDIEKAKEIGKGWVEKSQSFQAQLISIKKDSLALEKAALKSVQDAVAKNLHIPDAKPYLAELKVIRERLETYFNHGKKVFDDHDKWMLGAPRSNMKFIGKELKLGDVNSEKYKAVALGVKHLLTDVATEIAATQKAWKDDLKLALENQLDKLSALEKILNKESSKAGAFLDQIAKETERFATACHSVFMALNVEAATRDLSDVKSGAMAEKPKVSRDQKYQQYEQRLGKITEAEAWTDKNYGRVIKSVPKEFMSSWMASSTKKKLDETKSGLLLKLKTARKLFTMLIGEFQKRKLV